MANYKLTVNARTVLRQIRIIKLKVWFLKMFKYKKFDVDVDDLKIVNKNGELWFVGKLKLKYSR